MLQVFLISAVLLSASSFASPLAGGKADLQQTDQVQCFSESTCEGAGRKLTLKECCLENNMLYYSTADGCNQCILYGWRDTSVRMEERHEPYKLEVGYLKGSGPDLMFRVTVEQGTSMHPADYTVSPRQLTVHSNTALPTVEVDTLLDGVALEPDEHFTLKLEVIGSSVPGFFQHSLDVTLVDTDVLEISMTSAEYRVSEGNGTMTVGMKKNKRIASPLGVTIKPRTVAQAMTWTDIALPVIPANNRRSPNRATACRDFDDNFIQAVFPPDQDSPVSDLIVSIPIIEDDINEAPEEYFVVRVDPTTSDNSLVQFNVPQASLCKIVDDDPIRIGFTQPTYTISRPQYYEEFDVVEVAKEDGRVSEQNFEMIIQAVAASPSPSIGVVAEEMLHMILGGSSRLVVKLFDSNVQKKVQHLFLEPYFLPSQTVAFQLVVSGENDPFFLPPKNLNQSTFVIIEA